jgi:hypothetical protein
LDGIFTSQPVEIQVESGDIYGLVSIAEPQKKPCSNVPAEQKGGAK